MSENINNEKPQKPLQIKDTIHEEVVKGPKTQQKITRQRPKVLQEPKKKKKVQLSFNDEDFSQPQSYKITKNPNLSKQKVLTQVDQSRKSSNAQNLEEILKAQYLEKIQKLKQELIELEYQFWQGGQMIKKLRRKKKQKVKEFLEVCRLELVSSFQSLANLSAQDLLLVVKDFIVPHEMALYEVEALELRTKKNELLMNLRNVIIKKQGKQITLSISIDNPVRIIQRSKYEKNKQSYPFCNWRTLKLSDK